MCDLYICDLYTCHNKNCPAHQRGEMVEAFKDCCTTCGHEINTVYVKPKYHDKNTGFSVNIGATKSGDKAYSYTYGSKKYTHHRSRGRGRGPSNNRGFEEWCRVRNKLSNSSSVATNRMSSRSKQVLSPSEEELRNREEELSNIQHYLTFAKNRQNAHSKKWKEMCHL